MINKDLSQLSVEEILKKLKEKTITPKEILENSKLKAQKNKNNKIFITENYDNLIHNVEENIKNYNENKNRSLEGIPIVLKDNVCTNGILTTSASKMLENFIPDYDAEIVQKLKRAGALIVGKANMDEFAMGSFGNYSYFGAAINPWSFNTIDKKEYFCGGSSSGSAGAVAAGIVPVAIGSDTGGSCRVPASFCGIVGFKPTYGAISRYGIIPLSSTLDTVSLFSRTVKDSKLLFDVLIGKDEKDPSSIDVRALVKEEKIPNTKKVAIIKEFNDCPDVLPSIYKVKDFLEKIGYIVEEINVPEVSYCLPLYANIVPIETMSNFARYDGLRYGLQLDNFEGYDDYVTAVRTSGLGEEVKRRIVAGAYMASHYDKGRCVRAYSVKRLIEDKMSEVFENYDLVLHPTCFSHSVAVEDLHNIDPISILKTDKYTVLGNIIGAPTISIPIDLHVNGLPIGVSLMANCLQDDFLLSVSEKICDHFKFYEVLNKIVIREE